MSQLLVFTLACFISWQCLLKDILDKDERRKIITGFKKEPIDSMIAYIIFFSMILCLFGASITPFRNIEIWGTELWKIFGIIWFAGTLIVCPFIDKYLLKK